MDIFFGTDTAPRSSDCSPAIIRKMVVLPAPFGPTRPTFSPGLSWKEVSTKRTCRPYCLLMRERESTRIQVYSPDLAAPCTLRVSMERSSPFEPELSASCRLDG